jgi:ABC-type multidrug transport system, ATPase component
MNYVLEVTNLKKKYENFELDNVSFKIKKGSVVGFVGINGAGKTTTIKSILGLLNYDEGKIELFGEEVTPNNVRVKQKIGVVLDNSYYYEELTIHQIKTIVARSFINWDEKKYKFYIEKFRLIESQTIKSLSKGMKVKFSIALALSHHAELLILDEPTSGLDPLIRSEIIDILGNYAKEEGNTVLFSSHIISDLEKIADEIIVITRGKITLADTTQSLLEKYNKSLDEIILDQIKSKEEYA